MPGFADGAGHLGNIDKKLMAEFEELRSCSQN
jgi:hypothetical protein